MKPGLKTSAQRPENPFLIKAMHDIAKEDSGQTRQALYHQLRLATFVVPVQEGGQTAENPSGEIDKPANFSFFIKSNARGETFILTFTDRESMLMWNQAHQAHLVVVGKDLYELAAKNQVGIVINMLCPIGGFVGVSELQALAAGQEPRPQPRVEEITLPDNREILLRMVSRPVAKELTNEILRCLPLFTPVRAAYLFEVFEEGQPGNLMLGVHLDEGQSSEQIQALMRSIGNEIFTHVGKERFLDMMVLNDTTMLASVESHVPPLYTRQSTAAS